ncbi:MAG TPA: CBS domain-containing protein [Thermoanaerobaculia bacterium]|jgi:acetoin utilization protein AcuB|nr:CBS domain-containing protein [Thermoanaerobaculia bacterium]
MSPLKVRDLMTVEVLSVHPAESVDKVYDALTERGLRHVAVIDGEGDLVGIVSQEDLLRHGLAGRSDLPPVLQRVLLRQTRVEEIMTSEVETAAPDQPLEDAAQVMSKNQIGCLPVVEDWRVVGFLSASDVMKHLTGSPHPPRARA